MKTIAFAVMLALIGCSKKSEEGKSPDPPPAPAALSCSDVLTKAYAGLPGDNPQMATVKSKLTEVMVRRCTEDKWPTSVLQCYQAATSQPSMKACRDGLPPELKQKATAEIMAVMGSAGGGGGTMPHGAPPAGSGN